MPNCGVKIIPHKLGYSGFYERLDTEVLAEVFAKFLARKAEYFSLGAHAEAESRIRCLWRITTDKENIEPDEWGEDQVIVFLRELADRPWLFARIRLEHALQTKGELKLNLSEVYRGEFFEIKIDDEIGNIDAECRFSDGDQTRAFLTDIVTTLGLSEKPKKHSREVPPKLETKLLCDSLHLCNVCRREDVHIHHIIPVEHQGETVEENLIVLCTSHHGSAHTKRELTKNLKPEHLREYKRRHLEWVKDRGKPQSLGSIESRDEKAD